MGRLLAFQLQKHGHQITLFDQDPIDYGNAAAYTAAGMLTPFTELETAEQLIQQLGIHSLNLWPQLARDLQSDLGFNHGGTLVIAHRNDQADLTRFNQQLQFKLGKNSPYFQHQSQAELSQLEPELSDRFNHATFLPLESWLCPKCVMKTLADHLLDRRIAWYSSTFITQVSPHTLSTKKQTFHFDWVIDCRGTGAKLQWPNVRAVRGELLWLQAPEVKINRMVRLMHPRYRLYLVPRLKDDLYVIGATQIESDDTGPITVRSSLELLSAVYSIHPGFAEARVLESKSNCRPALPNNLPKVLVESGLIKVNGLFRHGFLIAPAIAEQISALINESSAITASNQCEFPKLIGFN